jgi:hypothetical protein
VTDVTLSPDQLALVRLMQLAIRTSDYVHEWRWLFQDSMIRAVTVRGKRVTLARDAVQALVDWGLLSPSVGGSFYLTDLGRGI